MRIIDGDELLYKVIQIKYLRKIKAKSLVEECKEIKAIPIEYIKEWFKRDDDFWSPNVLDYFNKLYDDWKKENESNINI